MGKEFEETHRKGVISIDNLPRELNLYGDFGVKIAEDGRVWVCINGISFVRFKPLTNKPEAL